jgi:hypothetical protein
MDRYEWMAIALLSLFLIPIGYVIRWVVAIIRSPKLPPTPPIETEPWTYGGQELAIIYRKGARPDQHLIDEIKSNVKRYEEMIAAYVKETEEYQEEFKRGLILDSITFPICDDEFDEFDFSIGYKDAGGSDMSFEAYFKDGRVQSLSAGD